MANKLGFVFWVFAYLSVLFVLYDALQMMYGVNRTLVGTSSLFGFVSFQSKINIPVLLPILTMAAILFRVRRLGESSIQFPQYLSEIKKRNLTSEDQSKINSEVNQILNQRFTLSTATFTIFAAFSAVLIQFRPAKGAVEVYVLGITAVILALIGLFFAQSYFLRQLHRTYGTYLRLAGGSTWETDFNSYRTLGYFAYTKAETILYAVVTVVATSYPFFIAFLDGRDLSLIAATSMLLTSGIFLVIFMLGVGFFNWFDRGIEVAAKWSHVLSFPSGEMRVPIADNKQDASQEVCSTNGELENSAHLETKRKVTDPLQKVKDDRGDI